jgi:large subunit ribosomal protein L4
MQVPVRNMAGETVDTIDLRDDVFAIEPNVAVMHQALLRQMANARLGTHKVKTRGEVSGGGRKPRNQKAPGAPPRYDTRAALEGRRRGVLVRTARLWPKMNRKMRRLALRSALSAKAAESQLVVLDRIERSSPTKDMAAFIRGWASRLAS